MQSCERFRFFGLFDHVGNGITKTFASSVFGIPHEAVNEPTSGRLIVV